MPLSNRNCPCSDQLLRLRHSPLGSHQRWFRWFTKKESLKLSMAVRKALNAGLRQQLAVDVTISSYDTNPLSEAIDILTAARLSAAK